MKWKTSQESPFNQLPPAQLQDLMVLHYPKHHYGFVLFRGGWVGCFLKFLQNTVLPLEYLLCKVALAFKSLKIQIVLNFRDTSETGLISCQ